MSTETNSSRIVARHLTTSERKAQRAGASWWIYVDGIGFFEHADVRIDLDLAVDAPPGTAWKAGLAKTRGTLRSGVTE